MKTGIELIAEERQRQIDQEGFSANADAGFTIGELAMAGASYALPYHARLYKAGGVPHVWPFSAQMWKPTPGDRRRELAKAGALIAAEIDRLNAMEDSGR